MPDYQISLSAVKLVRLGYVEKSVEQGNNPEEEFFAYRATEDGLDAFVKHEDKYTTLLTPPPAPRHYPPAAPKVSGTLGKSGFEDMDDDIKF